MVSHSKKRAQLPNMVDEAPNLPVQTQFAVLTWFKGACCANTPASVVFALRAQCPQQKLKISDTHFPRLPCKFYGQVFTSEVLIHGEMCWPL